MWGFGLRVPELMIMGLPIVYSLHCSSFLGLPFRILNTKLVKPKKGTTMETIGRAEVDDVSCCGLFISSTIAGGRGGDSMACGPSLNPKGPCLKVVPI